MPAFRRRTRSSPCRTIWATSDSVSTGMRTVRVPVDDQEQVLRFHSDRAGFTVPRAAPIPTGRWIELASGRSVVTRLAALPDVAR